MNYVYLIFFLLIQDFNIIYSKIEVFDDSDGIDLWWEESNSIGDCLGRGINASSRLKRTKKYNYDPNNLGKSLENAWIEGVDSYGIGESFSVSFSNGFYKDANLDIDSFIIFNGYFKTKQIWENNSRVKTLRYTLNNKFIATIELLNIRNPQRVTIPKVYLNYAKKYILRFEIMDIYKGKKYKDTAISGIAFFGKSCG